MREAFTTLNSQFGSVNGVIHSAGIVGEDSFLTLSEGSEEDQISQLVGKLGGLRVLNKLSSEQDLDFVILCSSLSPVLGGLGFAAYASANAVLDRHAKDQAAALNPRWISINWEGWRESPDGATSLGQLESQKNELTDQEGCEVFDRIMDQRNLYRVIVSTTDFERRRERWVTRRVDPKKSSGMLQSHSRPHHLGPVQQPSTEIEKRLVVLWEELLGIAPIGTEDNFFETGGNSLVLTQFIASAREEFSLDLPLASVFESPTIGNISVIIEELIERSRSRNQEREQGVI